MNIHSIYKLIRVLSSQLFLFYPADHYFQLILFISMIKLIYVAKNLWAVLFFKTSIKMNKYSFICYVLHILQNK